LLVIFSRAEELLKEAKNLLDAEEEDDDGGNNSLSPAERSSATSSIRSSPPRAPSSAGMTRPLASHFFLHMTMIGWTASGGLCSGEGAKIAERLCALLDRPEIPRELPLGSGACSASPGLKEWARRTAKKDLPGLYRWMVRSFCALLDPEDRA
jgi:hypothetical protein